MIRQSETSVEAAHRARARPALLEIKALYTYFYTDEGVVRAVDGVDLSVGEAETVGVVGESGCGKTITFYSVMRLLQNTTGRIVRGQVFFEGADLLQKTEREMRDIRGRRISMIYQEPMTSLNPVFTVGFQIGEAIRIHEKAARREALEKAIAMLRLVGIPYAEERINDYPFQFSGGMRQRVMLAMALACSPRLLIADEPTTALDVTIQAQILSLMDQLKADLGLAAVIITHDLGIVAERTDKVVVMYAGRVVEVAPTAELFANPSHPYTVGLLGAVPRIDMKKSRLASIGGSMPNPLMTQVGCRFHPRCPFAKELCRVRESELFQVGAGHQARCWKLVDYRETEFGRSG